MMLQYTYRVLGIKDKGVRLNVTLACHALEAPPNAFAALKAKDLMYSHRELIQHV